MKKVCYVCDGTGYEDYSTWPSTESSYTQKCNVCNGTGELEEYEEICPECKGETWNSFDDFESGKPLFKNCKTCNNERKLNWIDKIKNGIRK